VLKVVTQMLRQGDAQVFERYSQAKLNMMRSYLCDAAERRGGGSLRGVSSL
jgi:hypothetical protein